MMQVIREKAHGIITWVIVGLIALAFCLVGVSGYVSNNSGANVAEVNGVKITKSEVENLYNRWMQYAKTQKGFDINKVNLTLIRQQLTKSLVEQQAIVSSLILKGFGISDMLLVANIQNDTNLQQDGKFSLEKYKNLLRNVNVDEATFEQLRREELLMNQAQQSIIASSFTLPSEVEGTYSLMMQVRNIGYAILPVSKYQAAAKVSDEAINEFYTKHAQQFTEPQEVKLQYVELAIDNLVPQGPVDEQILREYYKSNIQLFVEPELIHVRHFMVYAPEGSDAKQMAAARSKIDAVYSQLQGGADFVDLVKKSSEDTQTVKTGGDLGWIGKNDDLPAEVFSLSKGGDYTVVVQTNFGWHIFQLVERKHSAEKDFASVKKIVEARYKRETAERLFSAAGEELANLTFENPKSLTVASEKLNLPIQTTDFITQQSNSGIASSNNVRVAAFSSEVLDQQNNSDLIRVSDDMYIVLRVSEVKPERQLGLTDVRDKIKQFLQTQEAQAQAKQVGNQLIAKINQGIAASKAASELKLDWKVVNNVGRDARNLPAGFAQNVFMLPTPDAQQKTTASGFNLANGDVVVAEVTKVSDGANNSAVNKLSMLQDIGSKMSIVKGRTEYESFQARLIDQAKIKYTAKQE